MKIFKHLEGRKRGEEHTFYTVNSRYYKNNFPSNEKNTDCLNDIESLVDEVTSGKNISSNMKKDDIDFFVDSVIISMSNRKN